ncbi:endonuclease/exonuclease/phosphatase family protein [Marinactinospora thermotolerans]|uniref:endonuclease/exonuclease/phosphatase family protein n=1 Tax=Marinactinospora thermotolerans TaxID=531310 RepID=UPI001185B227
MEESVALSYPRTAAAVVAVLTTCPLLAAGPAWAGPGDGLRVHDIQGVTRTSPYAGTDVSGLTGVVTAVNAFGQARGFWFQDPQGDGDPRTSEALFVFTGTTTPAVRPGDAVQVAGTVEEYRPGGADSVNQTITQLGDATWTVTSSGEELPAAVDVDRGAVPDTHAPSRRGDLSERELRPGSYALDYWAAHEHMRVRVTDARVVGPTDGYDALWVTTKPRENPTRRGGTAYTSYDGPNTGRLKVESLIPFSQRPFPRADVGDELAGVTEGPLYYSAYGGYLVKATTLGEHVDNGLRRETTRRARDWELSVATYNVENLSARDGQQKFDRLATEITENLASPDILALEEIQDDSGPTDDGTVDPTRTLNRLTAAIEAAGGPAYEWRQVSPVNNADGGQPGGNIRNAFLVNPARVSFTDIPGGDATTPVEVRDTGRGGPGLSVSPGRIQPGDQAWTDSRKPLVGQFEFQGRRVFVVTVHFASKGGDQPLHGVRQPPQRVTEAQREAQSELVRDFTDELLAADRDANVLVVGDLNDFWFAPTLRILTGRGGLHNPMTRLPESERYSYVYDGNSQALDHMLAAPRLADRVDYDIVHVNAEFHDQVSDHDPQVLRFRPLSGDRRTDHAEHDRYYD